MTAPFKTWTVLPHGKLTEIDDNMLTVVGELKMPIGEFPRRMTVVRLADKRLVIFSAIALAEDEMAQLEAFGQPAFLIVPSERHRLDAPSWKARYPQITVIAPPGAREKVAQAVPVDGTTLDCGDASVRMTVVPGTEGHEAALEVENREGLTLIVNEIIGDIHGVSGLRGWVLGLMGFAGEEAKVPAPVRAQFGKHLSALAGQFREWARQPHLKRIIVSHGDIISEDPQGVLNRLAGSLD